jgi:hypothetical protein
MKHDLFNRAASGHVTLVGDVLQGLMAAGLDAAALGQASRAA